WSSRGSGPWCSCSRRIPSSVNFCPQSTSARSTFYRRSTASTWRDRRRRPTGSSLGVDFTTTSSWGE
ncbi:unnamed protein product, partial [Ectocarpus sp. 6 AP-2014]